MMYSHRVINKVIPQFQTIFKRSLHSVPVSWGRRFIQMNLLQINRVNHFVEKVYGTNTVSVKLNVEKKRYLVVASKINTVNKHNHYQWATITD